MQPRYLFYANVVPLNAYDVFVILIDSHNLIILLQLGEERSSFLFTIRTYLAPIDGVALM